LAATLGVERGGVQDELTLVALIEAFERLPVTGEMEHDRSCLQRLVANEGRIEVERGVAQGGVVFAAGERRLALRAFALRGHLRLEALAVDLKPVFLRDLDGE